MSPSVVRLPSVLLSVLLLATACATTSVDTTGTALQHPLCTQAGPKVSVALYWTPQWRADQKEPAVREALAQRGIEQFISHHSCLTVTELRRVPSESGIPSDADLMQQASGVSPPPERVVLVVLRELGPRLLIGLPVLVEGGTEVVIEVRVLDPSTSEVLADTRTQWRNGGTFVVKGIKSLDRDLDAALSTVLLSEASQQ
jgi:hypothetical protein